MYLSSMYGRRIKRMFDILAAAISLVVLLPLLAIVALAIRLDDGRPCIFRQQRAGRLNQPFTIYKFRSMRVGVPNLPSAGAGALAVTRVGGIIRRTNIDELPQLWNVLKGDMSLIGPRPALLSQSSLLDARARLQIDTLRPGLTGLAQVNAYDGMPEAEKVRWEHQYLVNVSFVNDLKVMLRTLVYLTRKPPVY